MMRRCGCSGLARVATWLQHSDIDIAILPRDDLPVGFFGGLQADIEESSIPYDVDLVDLRPADPALLDEIRRDGIKWRD